MINIKQISQGFINLVKSELGIANVETEVKAIERLAECNACSTRSNFPNEINRLSFCKDCKCNLAAKSRSDSKCPLNKW